MVLLSVAVSFLLFYKFFPSIFDGRIVGGALVSAQGNFSDIWQSLTSGWIRDGLGASAPVDPLVAVIAPIAFLLGGNLQLAVNLIIILSLLVSALGAWFFVGALSRNNLLRLWGSFAWFTMPIFWSAISDGRLGAVLTHMLLPWLGYAVARTIAINRIDSFGKLTSRTERRIEAERLAKLSEERASTELGSEEPASAKQKQSKRSGSLTALGAASLLMAGVVAGTPVLLLPLLVLIAVLFFFSRSYRFALLFLPLPAIAVVAPIIVRAIVTWDYNGWRILLADPGAPLPSTPPSPTLMLFGSVSAKNPDWNQNLQQFLTEQLPLFIGMLLLLLAVVGLFRGGWHAKAAWLFWLTIIVGLATAAASSQITVASVHGEAVFGWYGAGVMLLQFGALAAAITALDGLASYVNEYTFGWRQVSVAVLAVLLILVPVLATSLAVFQHQKESNFAISATDSVMVPAVGQHIQNSDRQARVLYLETPNANEITYQLLDKDGPQLLDTSAVVEVMKLSETDDPLAETVAALTFGIESETVAEELSNIGVGAIQVPGTESDSQAQIVANIDRVPGVQRVADTSSGTIWRVIPERDQAAGIEPAWARIFQSDAEDLQPTEVIPASRLQVNSQVTAGAAGRQIILAESYAPGWQATLNGKSLQGLEHEGKQAFLLTEDAGELQISYQRESRALWLVVQATIALGFALLAIPTPRRRASR